MKRHILPLIFLIIASYWIVKPLFARGYFTMHDDTQVGRVIVMGNALRSGQFPVRWVSDLGYGYGYPLYNFYGPLPYYLGGGLYAAGVNAVAATKIMMGVGMVLSAVFMYALGQFLFGRLAGILAGILYAYAPYHAVQLYVRGAVGELWAYAFLPLLFLGVFMGATARRKNAAWIGGLGLAGIILSHTILGYITVVLYGVGLILYSLFLLFRRQFHFLRLTSYVLPLFIGLGFSAFFWLPAIAEMGYTNVAGQISATANFRDHFVCIGQLWNSLWGYGGSAPGCVDGMTFKIGKLHALLAASGVGLGWWRLKRSFSSHPLGLIAGIGAFSVFLVVSWSQWLWEALPGFVYIQYPWRMLTGVAFSVSVLGGSVIFWISNRWARVSVVILVVLAVVGVNAKLFSPQVVYDKPASFFESEEELTWRVSKVSDEYLPPSFTKPMGPQDIAREVLTSDKNLAFVVETEINTEVYTKLHVEAGGRVETTLRRAYFPGWQYWVNGVRQPIKVVRGLPVIIIPGGRSVVELRFGHTTARIVGTMLSITVVLWFLKTYGKTSIA